MHSPLWRWFGEKTRDHDRGDTDQKSLALDTQGDPISGDEHVIRDGGKHNSGISNQTSGSANCQDVRH